MQQARARTHLLAEKVAYVDEPVGRRRAALPGAPLHRDGHDQVHGAVLGAPALLRVGCVLLRARRAARGVWRDV
jgi:hypothetical protein